MIHFAIINGVLVQFEQPETHHRMLEAEEEKIGSCKIITWAVGAGIIFMLIYCLFTMTPVFDHLFKR
jgi:hypothetical protein